jgi:hypothetical protein
VTNRNEGTRSFSLLPFEARPITIVSGTEKVQGPVLDVRGDVRYYRFATDTKDPLLIRFHADEDLSRYGVSVHEDSPTGGGIARFRGADGNDAVFEVVYPNPDKYDFLEIANAFPGPRSFSFRPFEFRPISTLSDGQEVRNQSLTGTGDVWRYHFNVSSKDPATIRFRGSRDLRNYDVSVREGSPTGGGVASFATVDATSAELRVAAPDPNKDYYVEVGHVAPGTDTFSLVLNGDLTPPNGSGDAAGDVNGDGKVNISDALLALRSSVGLQVLTAPQQSAADLNGDGRADVSDVVLILRLAVGLK